MHCLRTFWGVANSASMVGHAVRAARTPCYVRKNFMCITSQLRPYSQDQKVQGAAKFIYYGLSHRTLVKIHGQDRNSFLQGLVTNDMELLDEEKCMYSHMLNVQGRTLYDIILYSLVGKVTEPTLLLECDAAVKDAILRHLKVYKMRRKVSLTPCPELSVWCLLPVDEDNSQDKPDVTTGSQDVLERDPRTELMGWRLIVNREVNLKDIFTSAKEGDTDEYHRHRYKIGLPEGVRDLPPGVALPLESNLVYMNGISFSKGCYIGQELTARTHHTGVVRKRLMPVTLSAPIDGLKEGASLQTSSGKAAGKYRAGKGELGLSLVRLAHAKESLALQDPQGDNSSVALQASVPKWWPEETK